MDRKQQQHTRNGPSSLFVTRSLCAGCLCVFLSKNKRGGGRLCPYVRTLCRREKHWIGRLGALRPWRQVFPTQPQPERKGEEPILRSRWRHTNTTRDGPRLSGWRGVGCGAELRSVYTFQSNVQPFDQRADPLFLVFRQLSYLTSVTN